MRILMLSRCPPYPLHLGDRLIIWHLARELSARGHEIDLLAFAENAEDWSLENQQNYTRYFRDTVLFDAPRRSVAELGRRALFQSARFPARAIDSFHPEKWREVERRVAQNTYTAAHLFGGIQVYEFKNALGKLPTVITPYESYSLYLQRAIEAQRRVADRLRQWVAERYERWMFAPYDAVTVVSENDRAELLRLNPDLDVRVIPNGVDIEQFAPTTPTKREPARLLFTGNYEYEPNVDAAKRLATEILPQVREAVPNATLQLVGNAPPPDLHVLESEFIEVTGRVPDLAPYLASATVFACPLRMGAGIKNKVLEAMAAGCPVVATPLSVDGIAVTSGDHALIASEAKFAEALVHLLGSKRLQRTLSAAGRELVRTRYSWVGVADAYEALYVEHSAETRS